MKIIAKIKSVFLSLSGLFFLSLFLFPYFSAQGDTKDLKNVYSVNEWLLSVFITLAIAWLLALLCKKEISLISLQSKCKTPLLIFIILLTSQYLGWYAFKFRPHLIDSIVQLWQAKIFASGQLVSSYPPMISFFVTQHMLFDGGQMYGQYPPGNALLLVLNYISPLPNPSAILLGFITLFCSYRFSLRVYSQSCATLTLLLFLFCAFFLFNNQSYMNHVPGLAFCALYLDYYAKWKSSRKSLDLSLLALALALVFICRPLEGVVLTLAFAVMNLKGLLYNKHALINTLACILPFAIVAAVYFAFNFFTTGDSLLPGYLKLWGKAHDIGFHESPWGQQHTLLRGLEGFYINFKLLNEYLFESPIPPLSLLGIYFLQKKIRVSEWDIHLAIYTLLIPFIYVFYWHRDSFLGPRYTYLTLSFLLPLLSHALLNLNAAATGVFLPSLGKAMRKVSVKNIFIFALLASALSSAALGIPLRAAVYASGFSSMKTDLAKIVADQQITNAIVFIKVSWGTRIISLLRERGVSASLAEKVYRSSDHCKLWHLVKNFSATSSPAVNEKSIQALIDEKQEVKKIPLNKDPSLRLQSVESLSDDCREEIEYDLLGYTIFEPHLLNNQIGFSGSLIYARDMRKFNSLLALHYPHLSSHYIWTGNQLQKIN